MRHWPVIVLLASASFAQDQGIEFTAEPVASNSIGFEVKLPAAWKVARDETGLSAQGKEGGIVVTREPFLGDEKTFAEQWKAELAKAGLVVDVKTARAGRYRAYRATWNSKTAPNRTIEVYRVYAEDVQMLYNVAFSFPKGADSKDLVKEVLKSFKVTAEAKELELEKRTVSVGSAGKIRLPVGCVETKVGPYGRQVAYRKTLVGYDKPKLAVEIRLESTQAPFRYGNSPDEVVRDTESLAQFILKQWGLDKVAWDGNPRTKSASHDGIKGDALTGRFRGDGGDMMEVYLWCGKAKGDWPVVLIVAHERETRLYRHYFKTILKSFESNR